jgi:hypothetical protein
LKKCSAKNQIIKMRNTLLLFSLLLLLSFIPLKSAAQGFYVRTIDLRVKSFDLSSLRNITFQNNNLIVKKMTGTEESYPVSTIKALYFNSLYTSASAISLLNEEKIKVYPNPAVSTIRIYNLPQRENQVMIIGSDGRMVIRTMLTQDNPGISVSGLTRGLYILKVENQTTKFIRQ